MVLTLNKDKKVCPTARSGLSFVHLNNKCTGVNVGSGLNATPLNRASFQNRAGPSRVPPYYKRPQGQKKNKKTTESNSNNLMMFLLVLLVLMLLAALYNHYSANKVAEVAKSSLQGGEYFHMIPGLYN